jgi:hypothetical protein
MHPFCDARPERLGQLLLGTLTMGIATLVTAAILFGAALYTDAVPVFSEGIPLSLSQSLEININPYYCCCAMSKLDCLYIKRQLPRAFQVVYCSSGGQLTLVSLTLPRR